MSDHNRPSRYRAYLLRCWQERARQESQPAVRRFSLEDPHTGRRQGFATLEAVVAALQRELAAEDESSHAGTSQPAASGTEKDWHYLE